MSRTTDTRQRVRELADRIASEGGTPSPRLIRQVLGKGSPNTILDELNKWHKARSTPPASPGVPPASTPAPKSDASCSEDTLARVLRQNTLLLERLEALATPGQAAPAVAEQLLSQLHSLSDRLAADRSWMELELKNANARFEAVQRHMLMQVDEARLEAVRWKELHQRVKAEFSIWQETMRQKNQRLVDEVSWLRGKAGLPLAAEPAEPENTIRTTRAAPFNTRHPLGYPGHPRVAIQPSDD